MTLYSLTTPHGRYLFAGALELLQSALTWPAPPLHSAYDAIRSGEFQVEWALPHDWDRSALLTHLFTFYQPINQCFKRRHSVHIFHGGEYAETLPSLRAAGRKFHL